MTGRNILALIALALFVVACGGQIPDYVVNGVEVYVSSPAPWLHAPTTEAALQKTLDVAFAYWEGWGYQRPPGAIRLYIKPASAFRGGLTERELDGWRVTVADDAGPQPECVQGLAIPHEIGHVYGAPADHSGPAWASLSATFPLLLPCP